LHIGGIALKGWQGKILWVDLSKKETAEEALDSEIYKKFIGGKGLGAYLLYRELKASTDPLGPENIILFLNGPVQALRGPSIGRWTLVTKSPLSGLFLDSHCGQALGREIKKAGYDAIGVRGKSDNPVVLVIEDSGDDVRLSVLHTSEPPTEETLVGGKTTIKIPRVAGRIGYGKPQVSVEQWTGGARRTLESLGVQP